MIQMKNNMAMPELAVEVPVINQNKLERDKKLMRMIEYTSLERK